MHNNIGFNYKDSEDMATEMTKNCRSWPPQCRLRPLTTEPPRICAQT